MEGTKVEWVKEERVPLIRAVPFYFLNIYVVLKRLQLGSSAGWFTVALILRPTFFFTNTWSSSALDGTSYVMMLSSASLAQTIHSRATSVSFQLIK